MRLWLPARGQGLTPAEEAAAWRTIIRAYFLVVGLYYGVAFGLRFVSERGAGLVTLAALTGMTAVAALGFRHAMRGTVDLRRLEGASLIVNLLMLANPILYMSLHFEQPRIVFFLYLAVLYALSGASWRILVPSVGACVAAMIIIMRIHEPKAAHTYFIMGIGAAGAALAMSTLIRRTLFDAVRARARADRMREEMQALADCDVLTGLPNRRSFFREMDLALKAVADGEPFDVALIDLDGFKPINDIYGHSVGDELLIAVSGRLRDVTKGLGMAARMGGDEFALVLRGARSQAELEAFGALLCDALRETYLLGSVSANISGSVGFVRCADASMSASQLLERADYALYFAKQNLRGAPVIFTERHETEMRDFSVVDQTLRTSDLEAELSIVFQPQIDVAENRTVGFEALARWDSRRLGPVRPDIFIKAAERSGLITQITLLLLQKALAGVKSWPQDMRVSFNLSARDLRSGISMNNIRDTVMASGIDPRRIEFEITETAMLTDFEQACEALTKLKAMGCRVAVDDFGSGYSSFSYIHRLPVDKIKIDRSFVVQLVQHGSALKIIKTIIDLCRNLNLDCVIEGVETQAEMNKLAQVKARYIQGYLFARPMPGDDVVPWLEAEAARLGPMREAV
ncbi:MAG: putative bifunctional diguanylate cyclase/phosphodiesterase [Asticcacaulis sp.]